MPILGSLLIVDSTPHCCQGLIRCADKECLMISHRSIPRVYSLRISRKRMCSVLQCAVCCSVLQRVAVYCIRQWMIRHWIIRCRMGLATISRLLKIKFLFCQRALLKRLYSAKETYRFKEHTNRSHPISWMMRQVWPCKWWLSCGKNWKIRQFD